MISSLFCFRAPSSLSPPRASLPHARAHPSFAPRLAQVADDNDLKTARAGFELCLEFFEGLEQLVTLRGGDEFGALQGLSLTA